jgi:hypothetical protein
MYEAHKSAGPKERTDVRERRGRRSGGLFHLSHAAAAVLVARQRGAAIEARCLACPGKCPRRREQGGGTATTEVLARVLLSDFSFSPTSGQL